MLQQVIGESGQKILKVIADPKSDEAMVVQATDRLEAARNEMGRTRTLMIFRIRRVLTDEQHVKLNAMHEHDRKERERRDRKGKGSGQRRDDNHSDRH